jgi:hypothetical protein
VSFSIQSAPLAAVDGPAIDVLLAQEERWFVERKESAEIEALAKEIASFANSDGGWVLVGVTDDGEPPEKPPEGATAKLVADPQQWLGQKLRAWLDPLPLFEATTWPWCDRELVVIRIWRSALGAIVHTGQGVIYERGASEAVPIRSQVRLRELAQRRDEAVNAARMRLAVRSSLPALDTALVVPRDGVQTPIYGYAAVVRMTPLELALPAFRPVALSERAATESCDGVVDLLSRFGAETYGNFSEHLKGARAGLRPRPFQRGFATTARVEFDPGQGSSDIFAVTYAADAGGALGARLARRIQGSVPGEDLDAAVVADEWLTPSLALLAAKLEHHYVPCVTLLDVWIGCSTRRLSWQEPAPGGELGSGSVSGWIQAGAELEIPAEPDGVAEVAWQWTRDLARHAHIPVYES